MDEVLLRAKSYSKAKYTLAITETILYLFFFVAIQISGQSLYLAVAAGLFSKYLYINIIAYLFIIGFLMSIIIFPLEFLGSFIIEHRFGLSNQGLLSWFADYIKKSIIGSVVSLCGIIILYYFLNNYYLWWWLYTAVIYLLINIFLAKIFPVVIIPLFYRLDKIAEVPLRDRLISLADRAGVKVLDIYKIAFSEKTKKANAALCGLGSTKRIIISDTLLKEYTTDEIEVTIAHELAHHKRRHFWKLNFYNFILTILGFRIIDIVLKQAVKAEYIGGISYIEGLTPAKAEYIDISAFPIIAILFITYNIIITPLFNYISRRYETEADVEAINLTKKDSAFAALIDKLSRQNLSDPEPNPIIKFFFYDHPPAGDRIATGEKVRNKL